MALSWLSQEESFSLQGTHATRHHLKSMPELLLNPWSLSRAGHLLDLLHLEHLPRLLSAQQGVPSPAFAKCHNQLLFLCELSLPPPFLICHSFSFVLINKLFFIISAPACLKGFCDLLLLRIKLFWMELESHSFFHEKLFTECIL